MDRLYLASLHNWVIANKSCKLTEDDVGKNLFAAYVSPMQKPKNFAAYCNLYPPEIRAKLHQLRELIIKTAPKAEESISYGMPTFKLNGPLVYFAAFKNHIGLYALPSGNVAFQEELKKYKTGRGSIQFPNDAPLPVELIEKIVRFRVRENGSEIDT